MRSIYLLAPLALSLAGCAPQPAPPPARSTPMADFMNGSASFFGNAPTQIVTPQGTHNARDPQPVVPVLVSLTIYQFTVPRGSVSDSEEFWKHVDEHRLDPFHYDVLLKNGLRAGVAPQADWDYFKNILARNPAVYQETGTAGMQTTTLEIPMKKGLMSQQLIYADGSGELAGQAYGRCDNLLSILFAPVYRETGVVHVKLTPLVRVQRETVEISLLGHEMHYAFVHPEYIYDVNLDMNIPLDNFLVVAPSSEAVNQTSIGRNFLVADGKGQQNETLLLISPRPLRLDVPVPATAPVAGR